MSFFYFHLVSNEPGNFRKDLQAILALMTVDYIILGQGLCGTFLSYNLLKAGKKVLVIDEGKPYTATKAASGIINPVTGRRIVRTWRIEELLPFALEAYTVLGEELNVPLVTPTSIIDFHSSPQMKNAFEDRLHAGETYLNLPSDGNEWKKYFNYYFGLGSVNSCLLIDLNALLTEWRRKLEADEILLNEKFDWSQCRLLNDHVIYNNTHAEKIFCCDGVAGFDNPYFNKLPFAKIKGEAIIARIPGLPSGFIYKQGISIVPWRDSLFWIGSSYEWSYDGVSPTITFQKRVENQLQHWLRLPYEVVEHFASERPATIERRPFVGLHPHYPSVGILNGMGTKGCSLAPFFAQQLANHLLVNKPLYPEVDVQRFRRILSL